MTMTALETIRWTGKDVDGNPSMTRFLANLDNHRSLTIVWNHAALTWELRVLDHHRRNARLLGSHGTLAEAKDGAQAYLAANPAYV